MNRTAEILRAKIRDKIPRIVAAIKKDVAKKIRDEILQDIVQVKFETPKELCRNPKETEAQAKVRRKKLEEWQRYIYGAEFTYKFDHEFVSDIVDIITEEIGDYLHSAKS